MPGYWKCLATMSPTLGANFVVTVFSFMHWTHKIEDKKLLARSIYLFIYFLRHIGMGGLGDTHGLLQKGKGVNKGLCGKGTL